MTTGSRADRLDLAVESLLNGKNLPSDRSLGPLLEAAALVRAALPPIPSAQKFEQHLGARLTHAGVAGAVDAIEAFARRELRHPGRILAAGAVSSAAVGVTVTAVAVWRSRRHAAAAVRPGRH